MHTVRGVVVTGIAVVVLLLALTLPSTLDRLVPATFVRVPLEAVALLALLVSLPARTGRTRTTVAVLSGLFLAVLSVLRLLDMGFVEALGRPFNPVVDWDNISSAATLAFDAAGWAAGLGLLALAGLVTLALFVAMPLAVLRIGHIVSQHRRVARRIAIALLTAWLVLAVVDVQIGGARVASFDVTPHVWERIAAIPAGLRDQREFEQATADDPLNSTPADQLLTGLRGKDVLFVFVESYGRVALEDPQLSGGITALLAEQDQRFRSEGFSSRSAFLTSPTFGGTSWLAHSTFQSGLWVDSTQRYDVLLASDRLTLSHAFHRAGWRTVVDVPANTGDWPRQGYYDYDKLYDSRNVGYAGPRFGYPTIPDQYTLEAFHRLELSATDRPPVMAEIDLLSSHVPWGPLPHLVARERIGDGSVYDDMHQGPAPSGAAATRAAYATSVEYSLGSVFSFMESHGTEDTVLVFMGDHQPSTVVTGPDASHDVPITIVAKDPAVFDHIASWGWDNGLLPGPGAPVWRMDTVRDRLLAAFAS